MAANRVPAGVVSALGVTQIVGYGTLYYSFSILAPAMASDLGISLEQVFAIFSIALFIGGLSAPFIGRHMDRIGAASVMTLGSALAALTLAACAWSPSVAIFALTIVLMEVFSGMVQYQAAFATLVESQPRTASRSITYLTLVAGFASTIFWPIAAMLTAYLSWRQIYVVFAVLNLTVCMPLHYWIKRSGKKDDQQNRIGNGNAVPGALAPQARRRGIVLVSIAFSLTGFTIAAILAHMVPMLGAIGLGSAAVAIGALFGPAQVLSRLINMVFGQRLSPPALAITSASFIVLGVIVLGLSGDWLPGAVAFAICLGLGSGINSIAQGSLPLYLFGSAGYGAITGKMAGARLATGAAAPFLFAAAMDRIGTTLSLFVISMIGVLGIIAFMAVAASVRDKSTI
ncbi:arsenite efflux MFS transporter ArsK [Agrobacterium sp. Azo12]|uniref:arsenite efflux MFS transporter ArsK n=1 Tax=Agrobacterium sp. Azo12 TaxID=3031129 RepID=UPI0023D7D7FC|nr:arsenite efflux MFS transporter ArsK [Agrobacterium sp. Azo12]MDO5895552.1 arsenite efflux MFS transporter ArsK [Agrobacterium sp. Azo12]